MQVQLTPKGYDRFKQGHVWIYESDIRAKDSLKSGDVVHVADNKGRFLFSAFYSKKSKIAVRHISDTDVYVDHNFFRTRIEQALSWREKVFAEDDAYRVIHSDADLLPGLVVDKFGDYLSVQILHPCTERFKTEIFDVLESIFRPKGIVNRSDANVRLLEGLELYKRVERGTVPEKIRYHEGLVGFETSLLEGQKTGAFLDQRENHVMCSTYARGNALDCFSYLGGFALQLATRCQHVIAVEISNEACGRIAENASLNSIKNVDVVEANVFDYLRDTLAEKKTFDTIVLDPPSFAKNKTNTEAALRGYKEINLRAMQLLNSGGTLISASCTHFVDEEAFENMLFSAAKDAKRIVQIIERRGAARCHPVLLSLRETRYLKCYILKVI